MESPFLRESEVALPVEWDLPILLFKMMTDSNGFVTFSNGYFIHWVENKDAYSTVVSGIGLHCKNLAF